MGNLIQNTHFCQGKRALVWPFPQDPDLSSVEAVEAPDGRNALIEMTHKILLSLPKSTILVAEVIQDKIKNRTPLECTVSGGGAQTVTETHYQRKPSLRLFAAT